MHMDYMRCGVSYGIVWYGISWYGVSWYGMVWYIMEWYIMEWCRVSSDFEIGSDRSDGVGGIDDTLKPTLDELNEVSNHNHNP